MAFVLMGASFSAWPCHALGGRLHLLQLRTRASCRTRFSAFDLIASLPQTMSIALGAILVTALGYQGELTIIAVVVSVAALIMLLPISGEPNFGPSPRKKVATSTPSMRH